MPTPYAPISPYKAPDYLALMRYLASQGQQRQVGAQAPTLPTKSPGQRLLEAYGARSAAKSALAGGASEGAAATFGGLGADAGVASGIGGDTILASGETAAMTPGFSTAAAAAPAAYGGMFAGQGLAGMSAGGVAGTAALIASPIILGPMVAKAISHSKPHRQFKVDEVLQRNNVGDQLPGFSKLDSSGQRDFLEKAYSSGFNFNMPGYADKQGNTVKNSGAFLADPVNAAQKSFLRNRNSDESTGIANASFASPQKRSVDDVLQELEKSPILNRGYISRLNKIKDFYTQQTAKPTQV